MSQVLMEGTPTYMDYNEIQNIFLDIEGVRRVHNLRIWGLSINKVALSAHLAIGNNSIDYVKASMNLLSIYLQIPPPIQTKF